jgi:hypothetical protein
MTVYLIKFTLFSTLALSFTAGREIGAAQVHGDSKHLTSRPGNNQAVRNVGSLIQTPVGGAGQNQQKPPARKRKSLYEYSPEDLLPGTQEPGRQANDVAKPEPGRARQSRPIRLDRSSTRGTPSQTPIATPTLGPAQIENSGAGPAGPNATPETAPAANSQREPAAKENRGKLTNIIVLFFLSLVVLIYLVIKLLQQLREAQGTPLRITVEEAPLAIEERPLSVESEPATERQANRAENDANRPKQKMRKARYG